MQLAGKTILVTGGTDGIGAQLIRQLRDKGATVITQGRNAERCAATKADGFEVIQADLSTQKGVDALLARQPWSQRLLWLAGRDRIAIEHPAIRAIIPVYASEAVALTGAQASAALHAAQREARAQAASRRPIRVRIAEVPAAAGPLSARRAAPRARCSRHPP